MTNNSLFRRLRHRGLQILIIVSVYLFLAPHLPDIVHRGLYTFSLFIKDLLIWMLPLTVTCFIAHAICSFERKAPLFIITLFLFEALSNGLSVWYAYGWGHMAINMLPTIQIEPVTDTFAPLWKMPWIKPRFWAPDKGSFAGILLGLITTLLFPQFSSHIERAKQIAEAILTRFFSRLIPLFILGFVARMYKTELIEQILSQYADVSALLIVILVLYIALLFFAGYGPSSPPFWQRIRHLLPATGMAFSSGCSLSTMPWTIEGTAKNLNNPELAKAIIPATTNIQQIGDCIINSFFCFLLYTQFNGHPPEFITWALFSSVFVLARFATAAVLGGAIFIMLPIYESYLHFTPEMVAIILALNVVLDPLVTCSNVMANGALARLFEKTWRKVSLRRPLQFFDK